MCDLWQGPSALTKAMGVVMEDLGNATYKKYKTCTTSCTAENMLVFVCSVLRSGPLLTLALSWVLTPWFMSNLCVFLSLLLVSCGKFVWFTDTPEIATKQYCENTTEQLLLKSALRQLQNLDYVPSTEKTVWRVLLQMFVIREASLHP